MSKEVSIIEDKNCPDNMIYIIGQDYIKRIQSYLETKEFNEKFEELIK